MGPNASAKHPNTFTSPATYVKKKPGGDWASGTTDGDTAARARAAGEAVPHQRGGEGQTTGERQVVPWAMAGGYAGWDGSGQTGQDLGWDGETKCPQS